MKRTFYIVLALGIFVATFIGGYAARNLTSPDLPYKQPTYALDGSVEVPAFVLPPSEYMSEETKKILKMRSMMPPALLANEENIDKARNRLETILSSYVSSSLQKYPVNIEEIVIGGIPVRVFTPQEKDISPDQVLINLHGGAFSVCWESCSILESAPIASEGGFKVISVNYRMAPESKHPAALEDIEVVYRELLKSHDAKSIGIYGCSAGGSLTAQVASWLPRIGLPAPGAIGIFGAGAVPFRTGDSAYVAAYIDGAFPPPVKPEESIEDPTRGYFDNVDMTDPIVSPALHFEELLSFPPTLVITGSRAFDMSPAIYTNSQLIKAGVSSQLIVGEGMSHCYIYMSDFPEAQDANKAIANFFRTHLE